MVKNNKTDRSWKDYFLKSGLPLEYSVGEVLAGLNISTAAEFRYERINEDGVETTFSIDIFGTRPCNNENISLELLVECKYRHESTQWIFSPISSREQKKPRFLDTFIILDASCPTRELNRDVIKAFSRQYPVCRKGIEIVGADDNQKTIRQAISQLQYCLVKQVLDDCDSQCDTFLGEPDRIHVLVPIIVTTAELWVMKNGVTIEAIKRSEKIEDVASKEDFVLLHEPPDKALEKYSKTLLTSLSANAQESLTKMRRANKKVSYEFFSTLEFPRNSPSMFVVVNYDGLAKRLGNLLKFFDRDDILKTRKSSA